MCGLSTNKWGRGIFSLSCSDFENPGGTCQTEAAPLRLQHRRELCFLIMTSIQLITNNEVSASLAGLQLISRVSQQEPVWDVYCFFTQVVQMINKIHSVGSDNTTLNDV